MARFWLLLLLLLCSCQHTPTDWTASTIVSPTITASPEATSLWDDQLAQLAATIRLTEPPNMPPFPSCTLKLPDSLFDDFNQRFADWVLEQLVAGREQGLSEYGVQVVPGAAETFLVVIRRSGCQHSSHDNPGAAHYIMTRSGERHTLDGILGLPLFNYFEQQVLWDGLQWVMLDNRQRAYAGMSSADFAVRHIFEGENGWVSAEYHFPETTRFDWSAGGIAPRIFIENGTLTVEAGLDPINAPCDWSDYRKQAIVQYQFTGSSYRRRIPVRYEVWDEEGNRLDDPMMLCTPSPEVIGLG